jgi:predicted metal-dependent phosphotriesterase family hydrolase
MKPSGMGQIMTVTGPIDTEMMGITLEHEHVIVDFTGAEKVLQPQYAVEYAMDTILPYMSKLKNYNIKTFIECTPNYIGRDVKLLKELSIKTGINILTNTGYYAAANKKYIPEHAYNETSQQLADKWIEEWINGIDATGIKPGFIKLGVGKGPLDELEQKIVHAGAITHLSTGLKIAIHTGGAAAAEDEIEILIENNVDPGALIIVHAQNTSTDDQVALAKKGAWISLDGIKSSPQSIYDYTQMLINLKNKKLLDNTLISQDAFWQVMKNEHEEIYFEHHGSPYSAIFKGLIPSLKNAGFTPEEIDQLLIENPAKAYKIEILKK